MLIETWELIELKTTNRSMRRLVKGAEGLGVRVHHAGAAWVIFFLLFRHFLLHNVQFVSLRATNRDDNRWLLLGLISGMVATVSWRESPLEVFRAHLRLPAFLLLEAVLDVQLPSGGCWGCGHWGVIFPMVYVNRLVLLGYLDKLRASSLTSLILFNLGHSSIDNVMVPLQKQRSDGVRWYFRRAARWGAVVRAFTWSVGDATSYLLLWQVATLFGSYTIFVEVDH